MTLTLDTLREKSLLSLLDCAFAERLAAIAKEDEPLVLFAAALARREAAEGHICFDLGSDEAVASRLPGLDSTDRPSAASLLGALEGSPLVQTESEARTHDPSVARGKRRPLVLDDSGRLYLHRYWSYQSRLAEQLRRRALAPSLSADVERLLAGLDRYFPIASAAREGAPTEGADQAAFDFMQPAEAGATVRELDRQRLAAAVALEQRLTVISGGPGTGKTATVVKILALAIEQALEGECGEVPRIALVAPTGKAAATLAAAIQRGADALECSEQVKAALPRDAVTVHRCLGVRGGARPGVRHDANRPVPVDLIVVDEASMVDLALMTRLLEAVPEQARVILLGDEHQLASVEAGAVMGDVCRSALPEGFESSFADTLDELAGARVPRAEEGSPRSALQNNVVRLTRSYRYASDRGIGALAVAINAGDSGAVLDILASEGHPEVERRAFIHETRDAHGLFRSEVVAGFTPYLEESDPVRMLSAFAGFRVLSPLRAGRGGVEGLNREIEHELRRAGSLASAPGDPMGRPVLVTENDHTQQLFNGDIGFFVACGDEALARLCVAFPRAVADGKPSAEAAERPEPATRLLSPARLPAFEPAYAMTIHKSQGSEFARVAVVISDAAAERMTRQQLYTAITRAREHVTLYASTNAIAQAVESDTKRSSGLGDALCAD
ncbi:MAG: exodeoxyribonuclease V subunit alpha [Myxococcota bacterium]|jgi:exodeoxyribonuclease V alpha subunit|nr:exodeoxyribonuclease V subunit alpha [Myxococcota bacterium]